MVLHWRHIICWLQWSDSSNFLLWRHKTQRKGSRNSCCVHFRDSSWVSHLTEVKCDTKGWSFECRLTSLSLKDVDEIMLAHFWKYHCTQSILWIQELPNFCFHHIIYNLEEVLKSSGTSVSCICPFSSSSTKAQFLGLAAVVVAVGILL